MAKKNTVEIILSAKDQASKAVQGALGTVKSATSTAMAAVGRAVMVAGAAAVTAGGFITKMGVAYNAALEQSGIAWKTLLGTQEEANDMLRRITNFTKSTPFETSYVDQMAKYLHNAGLEGEGLFVELMKIADTASAFSLPQHEAQELTRQMSQVRQAGVAYTQDLNILQDRGIPIFKAIADQLGITTGEVKKMASEGKITSEVYLAAFDGIASSVEGASEAQSKTLNGLISTLKDNVKIASGLITENITNRIKQSVETVIPVVEKFITLFEEGGWKRVFDEFLPPRIVDFIMSSITNVKKAFEQFQHTIMANKDTILNVFDTIKNFLMTWVSYVTSLFTGEGNIGQSFIRIFNTIKAIAIPILQDAISFAKSLLDGLRKFWSENGEQIVQAVQNVWSIISKIIETIAPVILFIIKMLWDNVKGVINGALNIIMGLIKIFAGLFTGDFRKMWEGVKQLFIGAVEAVWNLVNLLFVGRILGALRALGKGILTNVQLYWHVIRDAFTKIATGARDRVISMVQGILQWFGNLFAQARTTFSLLRQFGENIFMAMWNTLRSIASNIFYSVRSYFNNLFSSSSGIFNNIWNTARTIFGRVKDAIVNPIRIARDTVLGLVDRIKSAFNFSWSIPKPKIPKVSVNMQKNSWGIPYPNFNVDWYDKGGIFYGPSIIGVGEKRPEFVGALDDLKGIVKSVIQEENKTKQNIGNSTSPPVSINIHGGVFADRQGLKNLERMLRSIRIEENNRLGVDSP